MVSCLRDRRQLGVAATVNIMNRVDTAATIIGWSIIFESIISYLTSFDEIVRDVVPVRDESGAPAAPLVQHRRPHAQCVLVAGADVGRLQAPDHVALGGEGAAPLEDGHGDAWSNKAVSRVRWQLPHF